MPTTKENSHQTFQLFENIALTFSGGGYRASTFSLGVLSYLNQVKFKKGTLLEQVKGLSTVSGGTLTGATYAYDMALKKKFKVFYVEYYQKFEKDELLKIATEKLGSDSIWKDSHKKRSIINAFALAYAELLTDGHLKELKEHKSHLEDICFNATDFSFGLAFRFQTTGIFGNYRLQNLNLSFLSDEMKIADAIASSSCFPMGFEPLIMPDDFVSDHKSDAYIAIKTQKEFKLGIGIMDGGIVDNQGIGSIMIADTRRKKEGKPYDLIMVCDVGSYMMDPWEPSKTEIDKNASYWTPKIIFKSILKNLNSNWWFWLPLIISAALLFYGFQYKAGLGYFISGGAMGMFALLALGLKILIEKLENKLLSTWDWLMSIIPDFIRDKLVNFENLKLRLIQRMLEERATSAIKMISNIFLKQIRRLNYNLFYTDENLKNRRITTLIYELTKEQYKYGESDEKEKDEDRQQIKDPGDRIYASALIASKMATTLWFSDEDKKVHRLKNLVSCGQFTACYNLLKYCIDLKNSKAKVDNDLLDKMIKIFNADWENFINDPYWLHNELIKI